MSENKRVRIVSNGLHGKPGDTRVFIGDEDVTSKVTRVTWTIGVDEASRATITFARGEIELDYVAVEAMPVQLVQSDESKTVVPGAYFEELVADLDAPPEPNERVRKAARRLRDVVRQEEA